MINFNEGFVCDKCLIAKEGFGLEEASEIIKDFVSEKCFYSSKVLAYRKYLNSLRILFLRSAVFPVRIWFTKTI